MPLKLVTQLSPEMRLVEHLCSPQVQSQVLQRGFALLDTSLTELTYYRIKLVLLPQEWAKLISWNRIILIISNTQYLPCAGQCFKYFMHAY